MVTSTSHVPPNMQFAVTEMVFDFSVREGDILGVSRALWIHEV